MAVSPDFKDLLRLFNDYQVKYLVVGGYAVIKYTEPRYTKDLDLWIKADVKNAEAVFHALLEFGAPLEGLTADDFAHEGYFYQMGIAPVRVDILMSITGVGFEETWSRRTEVDFDGIPTLFISREDLETISELNVKARAREPARRKAREAGVSAAIRRCSGTSRRGGAAVRSPQRVLR